MINSIFLSFYVIAFVYIVIKHVCAEILYYTVPVASKRVSETIVTVFGRTSVVTSGRRDVEIVRVRRNFAGL